MAGAVFGRILMVIGESADFLNMIGTAFLLARGIIRDWVLIWVTVGIALLVWILLIISMVAPIT